MVNFNEEYKIMLEAQKQFLPKKTNIVKVNKNNRKCKRCRASPDKFIQNSERGDVICKQCGLVQHERLQNHQNAHEENNGKAKLGRNIIEDDRHVKFLVMNFFNVLHKGVINQQLFARGIQQLYQEFKFFRSTVLVKSFKKGERMTSMKGLHMPTIVANLLFVNMSQSNDMGIPLFLICSMMNQHLKNTSKPLISFETADTYRSSKHVGLQQFFKSKKFKEHDSKPSNYVSSTMNYILYLKNKELKKIVKDFADELQKEYSEFVGPSKIALYALYFVGNIHRSFTEDIFGLSKAEVKNFYKIIENSKNIKLLELVAMLRQ
jgi:hypothetical protein